MKTLSLRQPWAWLVVHVHKDIENRTWRLPKTLRLPARVYIHAGKTLDMNVGDLGMDWIKQRLDGLALREMLFADWPRGAVVGEVTITGCVEHARSRWFGGPYGYRLKDALAYDQPIPYKGLLGFFNISDADMLTAQRHLRAT